MENKYVIEYGTECELIEKVENGYKVRITKKNEVTEKIVAYEPLKAVWKYGGALVEKEGKFARLEKYTTYVRDGFLVFAYKKHNIARYSDDLVYETSIGNEYKLVTEYPFLNQESIDELISKREEEKTPLIKKIVELKGEIKNCEEQVKKIDLSYDLENKCGHYWEENGEEDYNDGKSTKKFYYCTTCGKEDTQYWHKMF